MRRGRGGSGKNARPFFGLRGREFYWKNRAARMASATIRFFSSPPSEKRTPKFRAKKKICTATAEKPFTRRSISSSPRAQPEKIVGFFVAQTSVCGFPINLGRRAHLWIINGTHRLKSVLLVRLCYIRAPYNHERKKTKSTAPRSAKAPKSSPLARKTKAAAPASKANAKAAGTNPQRVRADS